MPARTSLCAGDTGGLSADWSQLLHLLPRCRPGTKAPKAPWPGKDHHTAGSLGCPQVSSVKPSSPWSSPLQGPKRKLHSRLRQSTSWLKIPACRLAGSPWDSWPACNPPGKGEPFPRPGCTEPCRVGFPAWSSGPGVLSAAAMLGHVWPEQLAPLLHCCPGVHRPLWESSRYFYGKYYLLF